MLVQINLAAFNVIEITFHSYCIRYKYMVRNSIVVFFIILLCGVICKLKTRLLVIDTKNVKMKLLKTTVCLLSFVCLIHADFDYSCYEMFSRGDATNWNMFLPNIRLNQQQTARHHVLRFHRIRTFFNPALHFNNNVRRELIEMF